MIIYRNIGISELESLFSGKTIHGRYSNSCEPQNTSNLDEVICCFAKKIYWRDKFHKFLIALEVSEDRILETGTGVYYVPKAFVQTGVWSGRRGAVKLKFEEVYIKSYSVSDVVSINDVAITYGKGMDNDTGRNVLHGSISPEERSLDGLKTNLFGTG